MSINFGAVAAGFNGAMSQAGQWAHSASGAVITNVQEAAPKIDMEAVVAGVQAASDGAHKAEQWVRSASEAAITAAKDTVGNVNIADISTSGVSTADGHVRTAWEWAKDNPVKAVGAVGGAVVAAPAVGSYVLGAVGFGAAGVVKGSIAATIHGSIGNVVAGSAFAVAQSAGAGGACAAAVNTAVGGATIGTTATTLSWAHSKVLDGTASGGT